MCLSGTSSFLIWVALELNILAFLPIISNQGVWAFENTIKYFLVQSVASIIFLSSRIMVNFLPSYFSDVGTISILLKLGAAPLHRWFISILKTCSLTVLFFLSTIQKILPLLVCFNLWLKSWILVLFSVITFILILLSTPGIININKILGVSSVMNLIWFLLSTQTSYLVFFLFFIIYTTILYCLILILFNLIVTRFYELGGVSVRLKTLLVYLFMSLGGMPPFLGFLGKICVLKENMYSMDSVFLVSLVLASLRVLYLYISRSFFFLCMVPYQKISIPQNKISYQRIVILGGIVLVNYVRLLV